MRKEILILVLILFLPGVLAIDLKVERISQDDALILGLGKPATFDLNITNLGGSDNFLFYSYFGTETLPKGTVLINGGETKQVLFGVYPRPDLTQRGLVTFDYYIKGTSSTGEQKEQIRVNVIELNDVFEVGSNEFDSGASSIKVYIKNKVNFNFGDMKARFSSPFFDFEKTFTLDKKEKKEFEVQLNKEDYKKLLAGFYTVKAEVNVAGKETTSEGVIKFVEKNILTSNEMQFGLIINTFTVKKVNEGNVIAPSETIIKKNIISRLFTSFNVEPDLVERKGLVVTYSWVKEINPGETFEIVSKTNWVLPLLIVVFVVVIVILAKTYSRTDLVLKKRVSFVRAKGGEFALKITLSVKAKEFIEKINIVDRIPAIAKLYERFGTIIPDKIDEKTKRIEWNVDGLQAGEERVFSYIIYSKIAPIGKFELPLANALYEKEGKLHEAESNKVYFITQQRRREE